MTRAADGGRARSLVAVALVGTLAATAALVWTAMPAGASHYPVGNELDGISSEFSDPTGMPPGIVNAPCTPSTAHPYPVVLVHGTFANENFSWQTLAPMLANEGYCVFGLNYGGTTTTTEFGDHSYALDYIEHSAAELAAFVQQVLAWTTEPNGSHATQVELVGHSQGGMMPRYYIEHGWNCAAPTPTPYGAQCLQDDAAGQRGATDVHMLVGMAPSNHGADAYGLVPLFQQLFGAQSWMFPEQAGCGACGEQEANSPFLEALNGPGGSLEATPGVLYYVIESAFDEVVTPAPNPVDEALGEWPSAFLHGPSDQVANIRLQDQCPTDATEHIGIIYDPVALWDVDHALADNLSTLAALPSPTCPLFVPPLVSG